MLTLGIIGPKQGESYYAAENYYSEEELLEMSQWWGKGAAKFGLSGVVSKDTFKNLLHGNDPTENHRTRGKPSNNSYKERAGVDLTFSAPKSVSLNALVFSDKRLEVAHREAVIRALEVVERDYAQTRIRTGEGRQTVTTGNLVVAEFHHDNSRALDPHLHTHCIVLNTTQLENGKWQSILNEPFLRNKMWLGAIYRNELARRVQELGYGVECGKDGLFEIKGYSQEQLEHFSKRRLTILQQSRDPADAIARELAWKKTRIAKGYPIPRNELRQSWLRDCQALAVQPPQTHSYSVWQVKTPAEKAVQVAVEHCAERNAVFQPKAVKQFALLSYLGQNSPEAIAAALEQNPELIQTYDGRLTTQQAVQRELDTIRLMEAGKGRVTKITHLERVEGDLKSKPLTQGQREAITLAATTSDQFIAWLGVAGAGKTYALNEFCQIAQAQGYLVRGYAPSAEAAKVLGDEINVEANTVARLLATQHQTQAKQIWIVDEAGLLSARDAHALLRRATEAQARIILVGDLRQLSSVEAGNPFKSLQQAGISTAYLNESLRQKTEELRVAVNWVARGNIEAGFQKLDEQWLIVDRTWQVTERG